MPGRRQRAPSTPARTGGVSRRVVDDGGGPGRGGDADARGSGRVRGSQRELGAELGRVGGGMGEEEGRGPGLRLVLTAPLNTSVGSRSTPPTSPVTTRVTTTPGTRTASRRWVRGRCPGGPGTRRLTLAAFQKRVLSHPCAGCWVARPPGWGEGPRDQGIPVKHKSGEHGRGAGEESRR